MAGAGYVTDGGFSRTFRVSVAMKMLLVFFCAPSPATTTRIAYSKNKTFVASSQNVTVLEASTSPLVASLSCDEMSNQGFNPSLLLLPYELLNGKYFLASFRHTRHMCNVMCDRAPPSRRRRRRVHTTLSVLDADFRAVRKVYNSSRKRFGADLAPYEDVRLEAVVGNNQILATGMRYPKDVRGGVFGIFRIDLALEGSRLVAQIRDTVGQDRPGERNLGILRNKDDATKCFPLVYWLGPGTRIDVRGGVGERLETRRREPVSLFQEQQEQKLIKNRLSNSGSPVDISQYCGVPHLLLGFGHYHLDAMPPGTTRWGNTYVQHLVLINATSYDRLAVSPPFCFPSLDRNNIREQRGAPPSEKGEEESPRCEIVQFVLSLLFLPDEKNLIFSYGANDCVPAYAKVSIDSALDFVDPGLRSTLCPASL